VKRYVAEPGSDLLGEVMDDAEYWFMCRAGFVETIRAVGLAAGARATRTAKEEWPAFGIIEVDQALVEHAATLALEHELRSLDSLHLAAALLVQGHDLRFATWNRRLHVAARAEGLELVPRTLS
jgi:predicted nucleic acid-binding protein